MKLLLLILVITPLLLTACAGPITIDIGGGSGGDGGTSADSVSNQTFFILLIVLLVAMFAMILVAVSR